MDAILLEHAVRGSLVDMVDERVLVQLHDERVFIGYFRSFDQFNNLMLQGCVQRVIARSKYYADIRSGLLVIRGENVRFMAQLADDYDEIYAEKAVKVSIEEVRKMQKEDQTSAAGKPLLRDSTVTAEAAD